MVGSRLTSAYTRRGTASTLSVRVHAHGSSRVKRSFVSWRKLLLRNQASCVSENCRAGVQLGSRRFPARRNSGLEELVRCWLVVPLGDRRESSISRGVENEKKVLSGFEDHVMREFVLNHNIQGYHSRVLLQTPANSLIEALQFLRFSHQFLAVVGHYK